MGDMLEHRTKHWLNIGRHHLVQAVVDTRETFANTADEMRVLSQQTRYVEPMLA